MTRMRVVLCVGSGLAVALVLSNLLLVGLLLWERNSPGRAVESLEPFDVSPVSESRIEAYETVAAGTLRSLAAAQSTFVARCIVDQDGDGAGEYGCIQELAGGLAPRGRSRALALGEVFSAAFRRTDEHGVVTKDGYCYVVYLPTASGSAIRESAGSTPGADAGNADAQETRWVAYAWPEKVGVTGRRAFVITQQCEVYVCENADGRYGGPEDAPEPGAALTPKGGQEQNLQSGLPGPGQRGSDGQEWVPAR